MAAHAEPQSQRERSGLELLLAPIMGAILFTAAIIQSFRAPTREEAPAVEEAAKPADTGWQARVARVPVLGTAFCVNKRYGELKGNNLASSIAFQSFLSLFPLLLVVVAVVGFVASKDATVGASIVSKLGLQGDAAKIVNDAITTAAKDPKTAGPIGLLGLFWSGLGLVNAMQYGLDQVWQVEERGMKDKLFGLVWLIGAAVLFVGAAAATTVINWLPGVVAPLALLVGFAVNVALWMWSFTVLPNRSLPWKARLPGALLGAFGMEILKVVGTVYLPRTVANSSALYGSIGTVFAVLAWLLLFSRLILYSAVLNVVLWERRVGTVEASIEVPAGRGIDPSDGVTRTGRVARTQLRHRSAPRRAHLARARDLQ